MRNSLLDQVQVKSIKSKNDKDLNIHKEEFEIEETPKKIRDKIHNNV